MDPFRISATGHSLNYLPHYLASAQGFFRDEGLEVSETVPRPWDLVLDEIADGHAEAALGGIWVPSMFHGRGRDLIPFAQVSARAPLALIGRNAGALQDVVGKTVSMKGSNGASVGMYLKMRLREVGIDPQTVNYIQDLDGALLSSCFAGGMGDFLLIDLPNAMAFEAAGKGVIVEVFAITGGDIPWSVYYTDGPGDDRRDRFVRALERGMDHLATASEAELTPFLRRTFPKMDPGILSRVLAIYRAQGMWTTPRIDPAAYARWQIGIADAHLTDAPIPYDTLIDSRPVSALQARPLVAGVET